MLPEYVMNDLIKSILPFIGTALGGPLGLGAATFVASKLGMTDASQEVVKTALTSMIGNPEQAARLKQIENDYQVQMATLGYQSIKDIETLNASVLIEVNKTMQVEAAAEHWPTYSWRPFIGFMFGAYVASMWVLPLFGRTPVALSADLTLSIGGILGVASFFRGKMQADPMVITNNKG